MVMIYDDITKAKDNPVSMGMQSDQKQSPMHKDSSM